MVAPVVADLQMYPATAMAAGCVAGAVSTVGFIYLSPLLWRHLKIQDVCGIHNLHGMVQESWL